MRKFLKRVALLIIVIAVPAITWLFAGRQLSLFLDRFKTIESASIPVESLAYEGNGAGGLFRINDLGLSLSPANGRDSAPNVGTSKSGELALSFGGKVFAFGPLRAAPDNTSETLATFPQAGDDASISIRHSALSWPTPLDFNFMTGKSPSWKRHQYYQLNWKRQNGAKLEMLWRYEQYFYSEDGWTMGMMTREGVTGLIHVDIQPPN
jgi:hypothetical protein